MRLDNEQVQPVYPWLLPLLSPTSASSILSSCLQIKELVDCKHRQYQQWERDLLFVECNKKEEEEGGGGGEEENELCF